MKYIVLENSQDAALFDNDQNTEFIHEAAYEELKEKVFKTIDNAKDDFEHERGHYSITILGGRGSGKTTFAMNALHQLEKNKPEEKKYSVLSLGILDPTLLDSKEHVLLAIISKIRNKVQERFKTVSSCNSHLENYGKATENDWRKSTQNLAEGLKQLDGIGSDLLKQEMWDDSITLMEDGLNSAWAGLELNKRLHSFISISASILDVGAFVLALDDIDTSFEKGWPVLETLRKFLTSPRLITIVCGDMELYSTQVRKQQWKQLGKLASKYDQEYRVSGYAVMARELEDQYLLKVLKPQNRIWLPTVSELDTKNLFVFKNKQEKDKVFLNKAEFEKYSFESRIKILIKTTCGIVPASEDGLEFMRFVKSQSLRVVLQMLEEFYDEPVLINTKIEDLKNKKKQQLIILGNIFSNWAYKYSLYRNLQSYQQQALPIARIHKAMLESGLLEKDMELVPRSTDQYNNTGSFLLAFMSFSCFYNNPGSQLDYMLTGGLLREALQIIGSNNQQYVLDHLATFSSRNALEHSRRWGSLIRSVAVNKPTLWHGTIQVLYKKKRAINNLYRTGSKEYIEYTREKFLKNNNIRPPFAYLEPGLVALRKKERISAERSLRDRQSMNKYGKDSQSISDHRLIRYSLTIDEFINQIDDNIDKAIAGLPFIVGSDNGQNFVFGSIFNIIGAIATLLNDENICQSLNNESLDAKYYIAEKIEAMGQIRTYQMPANNDINKQSNDYEFDSEDDNEQPCGSNKIHSSIGVDNKSIVVKLAKWIKVFNQQEPLPAAIWSRIWQRLYFTLSQQSDALANNDLYLGNILHRQIIAFLNATLVETTRFKPKEMPEKRIIRQNPVSDDQIFITNYETWKINNQHDKGLCDVDYFSLIFSCPLWGYFLDPYKNTTIIDNYIVYQKKFYYKEKSDNDDFISKDQSLWSLLNLIPVSRPENSKPNLMEPNEILNELKNPRFIELIFKRYNELDNDAKKIAEELSGNNEIQKKIIDIINKRHAL